METRGWTGARNLEWRQGFGLGLGTWNGDKGLD